LASVYHKPPTTFVDPARHPVIKATTMATESVVEQPMVGTNEDSQQPTVIQAPHDSIIADLLSLDLSASTAPGQFYHTGIKKMTLQT
jgi:hypothetical protein